MTDSTPRHPVSHTPGPWKITEPHEHDTVYEVSSEGGTWISDSYWAAFPVGKEIPQDEALANARLIAQAPFLLIALEEFIAEAEHHGITERNSAAYVLALDAVALAKGEEPPRNTQTVGERGVW